MTTAYRPTGTERRDLALILARRGVRLERATDVFERAECNWRATPTCGPTEFRIHRDPAGIGDADGGTWLVGICCFTDALNAAQDEQHPDSDADLLVETRPEAA
ncbi:hypothetical protein [Amycolatopsis lexingtonensis]|uniref:hypothetical protein n=1 Tax=Amycolatopsis lexingtonensis TaxID=218822 RepID=UPI003F7233E6